VSQIIKDLSAGPVPPDVPTSFTTDISTTLATPAAGLGTTTPVANNVRVSGDNGLVIVSDPAQPSLMLVAFTSGSVTTSDGLGQTRTIIPFTLLTDSVLTIQVIVSGRDTGTGDGVGGYCTATVKNVAGVASIVGTAPDILVTADASISTAAFTVGVSGAQFIVTVTGVAGRTINWDACLPGIIQSD
jgi:hypothetical protein